jgi:hypothetical protein
MMISTLKKALALGALWGASSLAQAGYLVVNNDEWTLSNTGFSQSPDASVFINNITNLFTGDQPGNFLAYSNNFGLTQSSLANAVTGAGHSWTVSTAPPFTLPLLQAYDAVFLGGLYVNQTVVIDYLQGGGNVYIMAGTGIVGPETEANSWNQVLATAGLAFQPSYNGILDVNVAPAGPHPLLAGISTLYFSNGNSIIDLEPSNSNGEILFAFDGHGMLALGQFGELPPPSEFSPPGNSVPEPAGAALLLLGLLAASRASRRSATKG